MTRREQTALGALAFVLAVTAVWWALALWTAYRLAAHLWRVQRQVTELLIELSKEQAEADRWRSLYEAARD